MKTYLEIRKQYPDKTDAQIIEKLLWELGDKVETIGNLLAEVNELKESVEDKQLKPSKQNSFPVIAKFNSADLIVYFTSITSGVVLRDGSGTYNPGCEEYDWFPYHDSTKWTIIPFQDGFPKTMKVRNYHGEPYIEKEVIFVDEAKLYPFITIGEVFKNALNV